MCVDRVRELLVALPALERTIFLAELIGAFVFLLLLRRPSRVAEIPAETCSEPLFRFVRGFTGMALILFAVAITAEVFGFGDLADLIGSGTLHSAYVALLFFALVKVLQSLLAYALILRPLRLLNLVSKHRRLVRQRVEVDVS